MTTESKTTQIHLYLPRSHKGCAPLAVKMLFEMGIADYLKITKICNVVAMSITNMLEGFQGKYDGWEMDSDRNHSCNAVYLFWDVPQSSVDQTRKSLSQRAENMYGVKYEPYMDSGGRYGIRPVGTTGV